MLPALFVTNSKSSFFEPLHGQITDPPDILEIVDRLEERKTEPPILHWHPKSGNFLSGKRV